MFEKFLSGNIDTFRQRYEGTYGFYKDGRNRLLVRLQEISPSRCSFVDAQNIPYHVAPDHPQEVGFEFLPPKSAWYNTYRGAVYTQRLASRQWQRGVTGKTLEMMLAKGGSLLPLRVDFGTLSDVYEKSLTPKEALPALQEGRSVAISGQFAFDGGLIYLLKEYIGEYKQDGKRFDIHLSEPDLWRTEITDALTLMGCTANIQ
jgi:hypothetical protein